MSRSAITLRWQNDPLVVTADDLGNSELPDVLLPHQVAWLLGSAPCAGHSIPARRVAAQDQGGALAPATLSTQGAAARKRGGGLARRTLLTLSLAGHPSMPEGGAIKSLCCAAAGIFLPKPAARAVGAYPTTSVRQGAKDAATLRPPTAPHAQSVEGYKHPQHAAHQVAGGEA